MLHKNDYRLINPLPDVHIFNFSKSGHFCSSLSIYVHFYPSLSILIRPWLSHVHLPRINLDQLNQPYFFYCSPGVKINKLLSSQEFPLKENSHFLRADGYIHSNQNPLEQILRHLLQGGYPSQDCFSKITWVEFIQSEIQSNSIVSKGKVLERNYFEKILF